MTTHKNQNSKIHILDYYVKTVLVIQGPVVGQIKKTYLLTITYSSVLQPILNHVWNLSP